MPAKQDLPDIALPYALIFMTSVTCGVLAALAAQIELTRIGWDVSDLLQNLLSSKALQLRMAGPWWVIAGVAFIVSGVTAAVLHRCPLPWTSFRLLRWILGGVIVFGLSHVGHDASAASGSAGAQTAASLGALFVAALMAMFGAYFAVRR
jgi:hypothetical protein